MQNQFKPGDLALTLVDCGSVAAGSVVEFIRITLAGEVFSIDGHDHTMEIDGCLVIKDSVKYIYRSRELMPLHDDQSEPQAEARKDMVHG